MNGKILFKMINLNLNYLKKIVKNKFEGDYMKNII